MNTHALSLLLEEGVWKRNKNRGPQRT